MNGIRAVISIGTAQVSMIPCQAIRTRVNAERMALTSSQTRYLRGLAHPLKPVLMLGGKGVTVGVLKELEQALDDHELIKVRLTGGDRAARAADLAKLIESSHAEAVQTIGHIAVLYRRNAQQPGIALPR
jgi:RNA-binding protein